jgi:hypothetical protein
MESNVSKAGPEQVNASENGAASTHPTQTHRHEGSGALAPRNEDGGDGVRAGDGQRDVGRRVAIWWQDPGPFGKAGNPTNRHTEDREVRMERVKGTKGELGTILGSAVWSAVYGGWGQDGQKGMIRTRR